MNADTAGGAAMALRRQGHHVLKLIPIAEHRIEWKRVIEVLNAGTGPSQKEVLDFTVQLAVMVRAGINLRLALDGIAEQTIQSLVCQYGQSIGDVWFLREDARSHCIVHAAAT